MNLTQLFYRAAAVLVYVAAIGMQPAGEIGDRGSNNFQ